MQRRKSCRVVKPNNCIFYLSARKENHRHLPHNFPAPRNFPGFHQKQSKRPKFPTLPYESEQCKWMVQRKAQKCPALRAGRPTTSFPHTYSICVYSPLFQPGAERVREHTLTSEYKRLQATGAGCPNQSFGLRPKTAARVSRSKVPIGLDVIRRKAYGENDPQPASPGPCASLS